VNYRVLGGKRVEVLFHCVFILTTATQKEQREWEGNGKVRKTKPCGGDKGRGQ